MLYIDPNLHNPKVNGIPLLVGGRINPALAVAGEDLIAADGIVIDRYQDGTIKISADVGSASSGDSDKYVNVWDIDFLSTLPSALFRYLNVFFDSASAEFFIYRDHSKARKTYNFETSPFFQFDVSGNHGEFPVEERFDAIQVTVETKDVYYINTETHDSGQGILIELQQDDRYVYNVDISADSGFSSINKSIMTTKNNIFVSFDDYASGMYYWRVMATDKTTFMKSEYALGSVNFVWQQPPPVSSGDGSSMQNAIYFNSVNGTGTITCTRAAGQGSVFYKCAFNPGTYNFRRVEDTDEQMWLFDKNGTLLFTDDDNLNTNYTFSQRTICYIEINHYNRNSSYYGETTLTISPMPDKMYWSEDI